MQVLKFSSFLFFKVKHESNFVPVRNRFRVLSGTNRNILNVIILVLF